MSFWDSIQSVDHPHGSDLKIYAHNRGRPAGNYKGAQNAEGISVMSRLSDGRVLSTGKIGNDITHAHFDDKSSEMIGDPKYPRRSMLGQHGTALESVIAMHKAHPDYHEPFNPNAFEAVSWGEFGGGAQPQDVKSPSGRVLRGTAKLGAAPTVVAKTGALRGGRGAAKPPMGGKPASPADVVHDVMGAQFGTRRRPENSDREHPAELTLAEAIDAFRETQALVEAQRVAAQEK